MKVLVEPIANRGHDLVRFEIVKIMWIVVGCMVPLWFYLSQVYRAPLPYQEISDLASSFTLGYNLNIYIDVDWKNNGEKDRTKVSQQDDIIRRVQTGISLFFENAAKGAPGSSASGRHLSMKAVVATPSQQQLKTRKAGSYLIQIDCDEEYVNKPQIAIQVDRKAVVSTSCQDTDKVSELVTRLLSGIFGHEFQILTRKMHQSGQSDLVVVKYSAEYQVSFTLLVADPNDGMVDWPIAQALETISPLFTQLEHISNFSISSQILNYASTPAELVPGRRTVQTDSGNEEKTIYTLSPKDLTHFINSAEWNLESSVSTSPSLHFLLYIPSKSTTPLHILHSDATILSTNAFLIPQWGGITIYNLKNDGMLDIADMEGIMRVFAEQVRVLMGVSEIKVETRDWSVVVEQDGHTGLTGWEFDVLLRSKIVENCRETLATLTSLSSLLTSLENIVVRDHISLLVEQALGALKRVQIGGQSDDVSKQGNSSSSSPITLERRASAAASAISLAEQAFFDPTMVSLLYFPAQHLLAIYMPFFVPIAVPMIAALIKEFKIWKRNRGSSLKLKKD